MAKKTAKPKIAKEKTFETATSDSRSGSRTMRKVRKSSSKKTPTTFNLPAVSGPLEPGFPIVGIGASAGGLEALDELLEKMPADTGLAFVVVTHQHPGHTSLLPELLAKATDMPVLQVSRGTKVRPNHVYVAPPGFDLAILNGTLHRMQTQGKESPRLPIDYFFRSLADDQKERAICIVLSGAGTDGTLGLREIKSQSGMAMAEWPQSAKHTGMPSSAIATGLVDYVLPPAAMPEQLIAYAKGPYFPYAKAAAAALANSTELTQQVVMLLRCRTGHDFSSYKSNTLHRCITRRMNVHLIGEPNGYLCYLQENPHEIDVLFQELLISVTSFFRDPDAWDALGPQLRNLIKSRPDDYILRAWVAGCASGEEAYSLSILLRECMEELQRPPSLQVFGTDLDSNGIDTARIARYPEGIRADVLPRRLEKYFAQDDATYHIRPDVRDTVTFAVHNLIQDPPITKLDVISCRNVLIYMNSDLQDKLLPIFHYALKPEGLLFLGPSSTIGSSGHLFEMLDNRWKIFRRKENVADLHALPNFPAQVKIGDEGKMDLACTAPSVKEPELTGKSRQRRKQTPDAERMEKLERKLQQITESHQATVEELQTLNEELESLNEELTMVNAQLQSKLNEFAEVNNDLQNLLDSTDIATIFLDADLNIRRYTEESTRLIMLRPTDVGRPIFELASNLEYDDLAADCREVLRTLVCKESIVYSTSGVGYLLRVVPYRTTENVIDGLVLTFVDIERLTRAARETERSGDPFKQIVQTLRHPLLMLDKKLRVIFVNDIFCGTFQTKRDETEGRVIYKLGNGHWNIPELRRLLEEILPENTSLNDFEVNADFPTIGRRKMLLNARRVARSATLPAMIVLAIEDVTEKLGTTVV